MKKLVLIFLCIVLVSNTAYAGLNDKDTGNNNDNGSSDNIALSKDGDSVEITVSAKEGTSDIRYETQGYHVTVFVDNHHGDENYNSIEWFTFYVELKDNGTTGDAIIHEIPIFADGSGFSIEEQAPDAQALVDALEMGRVDLQFNARIGILHGGEYYGEYYDEQTPLEAAYNWSSAAEEGFNSRFGVDLNLDPLYKNPPEGDSEGTPGDGGTTTIDGSATDVNVVYSGTSYATIGADTRGAEAFNVTDGIPSSESCYVEIGCNQYLMDYSIGHYSGTYNATVTVSADVTYRYSTRRFNTTTMSYEMDSDGHYIYDQVVETIRVSKDYSYSEPYTFYAVETLGVYGLSSATVTNEAIGSMNLSPSGNYSSPVVALDAYPNFDDHFSYNDYIYVGALEVIGDTSTPIDLSSYAPAGLGLQVRNDGLIINGVTLMDDTFTSGNVPTPATTVVVPFVDSAIFAENLIIAGNTLNDDYPSSTTINYAAVTSFNATGNMTENVATNNVVVHTPVVAYPDTRTMDNINQEIDYTVGSPTVVIDQPFLLEYPNDGMHRGIQGYGNRDYSEYISSKEVQFGFDVYLGSDRDSGTYHAADTWISLPVNETYYEFFIPHWVDDIDSNVLYRTEAINMPNGATGLDENNANLALENYCAVDDQNISVVGQIYDFTIHGTTDNMWETFFFDDTGAHTGNVFNAGEANKYGVLYNPDYVLPMMPGKNDEQGYQNVAVKKGAGVFFSVKTVGNMDSDQDFVVVTPTYGFIDSSGTRQDVDVYVTEGARVVPISESTTNVYGSLNNKYNHIDMTDLRNTAIAYYLLDGESEDRSDYIDRFVWDTSKDVNKIGGYNRLALDYEQRVFIGETSNLPAAVDDLDAKTGIQEFYGVYVLPSTAFAVPAGTPQGDVVSNILEDGYIVVNFNISTIDEYDGNGYNPGTDDYLSYDEAQANMWGVEAYDTTQGDLVEGDAIYYYWDKTASEDYDASGTH